MKAERIPVIIPAYNSEKTIVQLLDSLAKDYSEVRPIVAVNGSKDHTAELARKTGAEVLDSEKKGKLPAIQDALEYLGEAALKPLIIIDSDSRPISRNYAATMIEPFWKSGDNPAGRAGAVKYRGIGDEHGLDRLKPFIFTIASKKLANDGAKPNFNYQNSGSWIGPNAQTLYGSNQSFYLKEPEILEAELNLPNIWPAEDVALARVVDNIFTRAKYGANYATINNPRATILSPIASGSLHMREYIGTSSEEQQYKIDARYSATRPKAAIALTAQWIDNYVAKRYAEK